MADPRVNTAPVGSISYSDTGLAPGANHTYTVSAIDAAGNESGQSGSWSGAAGSGAVTTSYTYDAENRLTQLASGSGVIGSYAYDGAGNRVGKTAGGVTTAYTLDLASKLPQVLTETSGSAVTSYAYGGGPLELDQSGSTYWYLTDTLGSVRLVTDSTGATPATYAYSAFGSTRKSTGTLANEVRFTGERTDGESGLEFLRARTYDPSVGTFLQRDSWGITATSSQSLDAYAYTANNPINALDPSGHCGTYDPAGDCGPGGGSSTSSTSSGGGGGGHVSDEWSGYDKVSSTPTTPVRLPPNVMANAKQCAADPTRATQSCVNLEKEGWTPREQPEGLGGLGNVYSQYVGNTVVNNPADFLHDTFGLSYSATVGLCGGWNLTFGLIEVTPQGCVIATTDGQLAVTTNPGLSAGVGLNAGVFVAPMFSTAGSAGDQKNLFGELGGGGEVAGGVQVEVAGGFGRCGQPVVNMSGGPAVGLGGHAEGGGSYTVVLWQSKEDKPC